MSDSFYIIHILAAMPKLELSGHVHVLFMHSIIALSLSAYQGCTIKRGRGSHMTFMSIKISSQHHDIEKVAVAGSNM